MTVIIKKFIRAFTALLIACIVCACAFACAEKNEDPPVLVTPADRLTKSEIFSAYENNVVEVSCGAKSGAGIVLKREGEYVYIVTCYHVAEYDTTDLLFRFHGQTAFTGGSDNVTTIGYDRTFDVSVFKVYSPFAVKNILGDNDGTVGIDNDVKVGGEVLAMGNAGGYGISATDGMVSKREDILTHNGYTVPLIRVTAALDEGMSGGAVIDENGKLIGMAVGRHDTIKSANYVLPVSIIEAIFNRAASGPKNDKITRPDISLTAGEVTVNNVITHEITVTVARGNAKITFVFSAGKLEVKSGDKQGKGYVTLNGKNISETMDGLVAALIDAGGDALVFGGSDGTLEL